MLESGICPNPTTQFICLVKPCVSNTNLELHIRTDSCSVLVFHEHTNTCVMRFFLRSVHLVSYSGRSCSCCCSSSKSTRSHSYSRRACRLFHNSRNSVTAEHTSLRCNFSVWFDPHSPLLYWCDGRTVTSQQPSR